MMMMTVFMVMMVVVVVVVVVVVEWRLSKVVWSFSFSPPVYAAPLIIRI